MAEDRELEIAFRINCYGPFEVELDCIDQSAALGSRGLRSDIFTAFFIWAMRSVASCT